MIYKLIVLLSICIACKYIYNGPQNHQTKNSDFSLSISLCICVLCFRHRGCIFPPSFPQALCIPVCTNFCLTAVVGNSNLCVLLIWTHKTRLPLGAQCTLYAKGIEQFPKHVLRCNFSILRSACIVDAKLRPFMPNFPPFATKFCTKKMQQTVASLTNLFYPTNCIFPGA